MDRLVEIKNGCRGGQLIELQQLSSTAVVKLGPECSGSAQGNIAVLVRAAVAWSGAETANSSSSSRNCRQKNTVWLRQLLNKKEGYKCTCPRGATSFAGKLDAWE